VRQAKLGISSGVGVPGGQGLANHPYRVLRTGRRMQCRANERTVRSVHRESCGPQGRPHSPKRFSLDTYLCRWRRRSIVGSLHRRIDIGEILEGLPGSKSVARRKRDAKNLGGPVVSPQGRVYQPTEGHLMGDGESDRSIVLRGGSADHMGKGATGLRSLQRKHEPDTKGWENLCKPHCRE